MHIGSGFFVRRGGGGRFTDRRCRGRRPRRPAEVSGGGRYTGGMNPSPTGYLLAGVGRKAAERSRPLPTMQKINGRQWQGCGPGMPGPYGLPQMGRAREGRGRAAVRSFAVGGWLPGNGRPRKARQSPSGRLARPAPHCVGRLFARAKPAREASPSGEVAAKQAGGVRGLAGGCPLMGYYGRLRAAYMPPLQSAR